ncbi:VWA domain-containing protein [Shinella daejeonensis]|uniref:vWA domain-containing protein n=1 Tax=Shinella daejeonensis TaxID=659017 RepID=UPI0020C7EE22|nr:VWA domain-containing protein [Shinella daejeonensis]MCP8893548.1 VWA domain-containing protein [Shinella daejeonensis]
MASAPLPDGKPDALSPDTPAGAGRLADNIVYFARVLRNAGLRLGPAAVTDAIAAVEAIGIGDREEFYTALHATLVKRHEDDAVFDEAFRLFWRPRDFVGKMIAMMSPVVTRPVEREKKAGETRVSDALFGNRPDVRPPREEPDIEIDARFTTSASEALRRRDFAQMTAAELEAAKRAIAGLVLPMDEVPTRRFRRANRPAAIDARATMRQALRTGGDLIVPRYRAPKTVHPPLVVLADISGSMSQYTRVFLHFLHALGESRRRVHAFLFGTRLTNVTRQMRSRDPDAAVDACSRAVSDWSGGTRIGEALETFNRLWSRRVLGQGAVVLVITDGLERDGVALLEKEIDRLHRSCRRLVWLNPLLRFDGFEPRARGVRTMLRHVDELRPVHNLEAMGDLVSALSGKAARESGDPRRFAPRR